MKLSQLLKYLHKKFLIFFQLSIFVFSFLLIIVSYYSRGPWVAKFKEEFQVVLVIIIVFTFLLSKVFSKFITKDTTLFSINKSHKVVTIFLVMSFFFIALNTFNHYDQKRFVLCECTEDMLAAYGKFFIVGYNDFEEIKTLVERQGIGGVYISSRNVKGKTAEELKSEITELQKIQKENGLSPLVVAADHEGGYISDLHLNGVVRSTASLSSLVEGGNKLTDEELNNIEDYAQIHADDLNYLGINLTFAPVVDIKNEEVSTSISQIANRSISDDVEVITQTATKYI